LVGEDGGGEKGRERKKKEKKGRPLTFLGFDAAAVVGRFAGCPQDGRRGNEGKRRRKGEGKIPARLPSHASAFTSWPAGKRGIEEGKEKKKKKKRGREELDLTDNLVSNFVIAVCFVFREGYLGENTKERGEGGRKEKKRGEERD